MYEVPNDRSTLRRREQQMRGSWPCEARCLTCGVETRTGGATLTAIRQMVSEHKLDVGTGWHGLDQ